MKFIITTLHFLLLLGFSAPAQPLRPSVEEVLKMATEQAQVADKHIMLIFHASWCYWCHKMDSSMNDPVCSKLFTDNYIITHLVVDESIEKKDLENPGASDYRDQQGGKDQGIPYWLVLDKKGGVIANSRILPSVGDPSLPGDNVGCPASEKEVNWFIQVLQKTSRLNASQLDVIRKRFRKNE